MFLYWTLFALFLLLSFVEQSGNIPKKTARNFFYVAIFFLFCLSFMRWERGTDWPAYYTMFMNKGRVGEWDTHTEQGYLAINRVVSLFTDSYTVFLFVWEGMYYILFICLCNKINSFLDKRTTLRCYFPILLFCYSLGFAGMFAVRSTFAYLLCFWSLFYVFEKKYLRFISFVVFASTFHLSALLFLVVLPLIRLTLNKFSIPIIIIGGVLFFQLSDLYSSILLSINFGDYAEYLRGEERMSSLGIIKWTFLVIIMLLIRPKDNKLVYKGVVNIVLLGVIVYIWCQFFSPVAQRLSELFTQVVIVWMAMVFYGKGKVYRQKFLLAMALYCGISFWSLINSGYKDLYVPFKFFWDTFSVEVY